MNKKSFTLIELMIIIGIISIITTTILTILKPSEILKNLRDTRRINDLKNIEKYILLLESEHKYGVLPFYGTSSIVYISLPDNSPTCSSWINQLPSLPSGYQYNCVATPTNIDSTGWIPINFSQSSLLNIQKLPIDPINRPPYYYTYVSGGSYKLTAKLEKNYNTSIKDDGIDPLLYELGSDLKLNNFQSGLVLYLPFDEGTGTIAYDYSGFNNNGTLYNFNWTATSGWIDGKVNKALSFDGVDDYVDFGTPEILYPNEITMMAWVKAFALSSWAGIITNKKNSSYGINLQIGTVQNIASLVSNGSNFTYVKTTWVPSTNVWYHIAVTHKDTTNKLYVNGILEDTKMLSLVYSNPRTKTVIGCFYYDTSPSLLFKGLIDEVRIYNRALSTEEIKALYEATK